MRWSLNMNDATTSAYRRSASAAVPRTVACSRHYSRGPGRSRGSSGPGPLSGGHPNGLSDDLLLETVGVAEGAVKPVIHSPLTASDRRPPSLARARGAAER